MITIVNLAANVIELHEIGFTNTEICEILRLTRGKVAGIIYRWKK